MSIPRIMFVPTHHTGLPVILGAALVEMLKRERPAPRFHCLGAPTAKLTSGSFDGSMFLDPLLYDNRTLLDLYERTTRGAKLSLLAGVRGLFDGGPAGTWTPLDLAQLLDCPVVLVLDCTGWGAGISALVAGFLERASQVSVVGLLLTGVEDREHRQILESALSDHPPIVGCMYRGEGADWTVRAPGPGIALDEHVLQAVVRRVDAAAVASLASQRGFLPPATRPLEPSLEGPVILIAGGHGFTPWSRDSIEVLRAKGARVQRLDLMEDEQLPPETQGLILAGQLWPQSISDLAENEELMRSIRVRVCEGLPTLALGGGMLYMLRKLQDAYGRTSEMTGILPAQGEILDELEEPLYVRVTAEKDTVTLKAGEAVQGWICTDAEIIEPQLPDFPLRLSHPEWPTPRAEGAAALNLLCSRALFHLASGNDLAGRFVRACAATQPLETS